MKGDIETVESLIVDEGVDINASDQMRIMSHFPPALRREVQADLTMVIFLLDKGADLFHVDIDGDSALHTFCGRVGETNDDILRLLLSRDTKGRMLRQRISEEDCSLQRRHRW